MIRLPWWLLFLLFNATFWFGVATHRAVDRIEAARALDDRVHELEEKLEAQKTRTEVEYWARQCDRQIREAGCEPR